MIWQCHPGSGVASQQSGREVERNVQDEMTLTQYQVSLSSRLKKTPEEGEVEGESRQQHGDAARTG